MTIKRTPTELLEGAYAIQTPQDNQTYYADFADHYDTEFAGKLGYISPAVIAQSYIRNANPSDRPVADIGCGTGLVAEALNLPRDAIHGFDISPDMLEKARGKNLYAGLHNTDLTKPLSQPETPFGAVISAGTFTHGHLGPEPLANLLNLAKSGALFCIGVNALHYASKGFKPMLTSLVEQGRITHLRIETSPIYDVANTKHAADEAYTLLYRKA